MLEIGKEEVVLMLKKVQFLFYVLRVYEWHQVLMSLEAKSMITIHSNIKHRGPLNP